MNGPHIGNGATYIRTDLRRDRVGLWRDPDGARGYMPRLGASFVCYTCGHSCECCAQCGPVCECVE